MNNIIQDELKKHGPEPIGRHPDYGLCPACIQHREHSDLEWQRYHVEPSAAKMLERYSETFKELA